MPDRLQLLLSAKLFGEPVSHSKTSRERVLALAARLGGRAACETGPFRYNSHRTPPSKGCAVSHSMFPNRISRTVEGPSQVLENMRTRPLALITLWWR